MKVLEKKCLFLTLEDFAELVSGLYDEEVFIDTSWDGLAVSFADDAVPEDDLHIRLAHELCVSEITSIHLDDEEVGTGVWLVCKNQSLKQRLGDGITLHAEKYPDPDYKDICISLQDDRTGILIQDICNVSPEYGEDGKPLHGRYKVSVYGDPNSESPTQVIPIRIHCEGHELCPCPLGKKERHGPWHLASIQWDTDGVSVDDLPSELIIEDDITEDEVADWLSDSYGWCAESFVIMFDKPIEGVSVTGSLVEVIGERNAHSENDETKEQYIYNIKGYTPENGKPFAALKSNITII